MIERRKHSRIAIHCGVIFERIDVHEQAGPQEAAVALDISEKGMLLETSAPIHASTIKVMVPVKGMDTVELIGNIIYSIPMSDNRYRSGIIFREQKDKMAVLISALGGRL